MIEHRTSTQIEQARRALDTGLPADPVAVGHLLAQAEARNEEQRALYRRDRLATREIVEKDCTGWLDDLKDSLKELRTYLSPEKLDAACANDALDDAYLEITELREAIESLLPEEDGA